jgi:3-(3-hydroxy-phenyl)propionate hydroxylase
VGSLVTLLLSHRGLKVAAIERDQEVYKLPRAVNLDGEIVRALQPLGLADELAGLLQPTRPGERAGFVDSKHNWLFGQELNTVGPCGWQSMNMFDQPQVEQFLRDQVLARENVDAFVGFTAEQLHQLDDRVRIDAVDGDARRTVEGAYLIACDGASSSIRKALDVEWVNLGYDQDWLVVDVATKPGHTLGTTTMQVCDPKRIVTYVCTKDPYRRWEFRLNEGETWEEMLTPETIHALLDEWTPRETYAIRRAAMYQFHAATAQTWQVGRVFIAGDAAHQTPPFLGQGMNTGMRDAINLAWKLPMVVRGESGGELLETYELERKAHAHDMVDWAVAIGRLMEHMAAVELARETAVEPPAMPTDLLASGYGQGREIPPLCAGVLMEDQVADDGISGNLYNQPLLRTAAGEVRLDERLGAGFAIVARSQADLNVTPVAQQVIDQLGVALVVASDLDIAQGHLTGADHAAIIVRPDRYVFGHTDAHHSLDDLLMQLALKLKLKLKLTTS